MATHTAGLAPFHGRCFSGVSSDHMRRTRGGTFLLPPSANNISFSNEASFLLLHSEALSKYNDPVIGSINKTGPSVTENLRSPAAEKDYKEAKIKVVGVGGGGSNAVNRIIESSINGVEFWIVNTDVQAMSTSLVYSKNRLQIGKNLTRGFSAGGNPDIGMNAAKECRESIEMALSGADMVFITAGMGGGTGTGGAPVIAEIAKSMGILTVGIVSTPFSFEGRKRTIQAHEGIAALRNKVDTLIVIPNDKLLTAVSPNTLITKAFDLANDIIQQAVRGISDIITVPGLINIDIADVRTIMVNAGSCFMGIGTGIGQRRARDAALKAMQSPLLDFGNERATGIVWNITAGNNITLSEVNEAAEVIYSFADTDANLKFGITIDRSFGGEVSITLIATGFGRHKESKGPQLQGTQIGGDNIPINRYIPFLGEGSMLEFPEFLRKIGQSRYPRS